MARQRLDLDAVVESAIELIDESGLEELALARVAEELDVQSSALYNHVEGLDGLRHAVAVRAASNLAEVLRDAAVARSGAEAVRAVGHAYRGFAAEHPGQYASTLLRPVDSSDELVDSQVGILDVLVRIVAGFGMEGDRAIHAARTVRSAIHGFVALEATDAFIHPQDPDVSFDQLLELVLRGLSAD